MKTMKTLENVKNATWLSQKN